MWSCAVILLQTVLSWQNEAVGLYRNVIHPMGHRLVWSSGAVVHTSYLSARAPEMSARPFGALYVSAFIGGDRRPSTATAAPLHRVYAGVYDWSRKTFNFKRYGWVTES